MSFSSFSNDSNDITEERLFPPSIRIFRGSTEIPDDNTGMGRNMSPVGEDRWKLIDNTTATKFLIFGKPTLANPVRIVYEVEDSLYGRIVAYSMTSANDSPERDPKDWTFEGSNDFFFWELIDTRSNIRWPFRYWKYTVTLPEPVYYKYYRINITDISSTATATLTDTIPVQLAEIELIGNVSVTGGGVGDPHINPIIGKPYYLPKTEETYKLFDLKYQDDLNIKVYGKCWFLPEEYKNAVIGKYKKNKLERHERIQNALENATYFKYIIFMTQDSVKRETIIIDMDDLAIKDFTDLANYKKHLLETDFNYKNIDNHKIKVSKIRKSSSGIYFIKNNTKSSNSQVLERFVTVTHNNQELINFRLCRDRKDILTRNAISFDLNINSDQFKKLVKAKKLSGALIKKEIQNITDSELENTLGKFNTTSNSLAMNTMDHRTMNDIPSVDNVYEIYHGASSRIPQWMKTQIGIETQDTEQ